MHPSMDGGEGQEQSKKCSWWCLGGVSEFSFGFRLRRDFSY